MQEYIKQLQCIVLPGKHIPAPAGAYYELVYNFWHETWFDTFKYKSRVKTPEVLYSDDFRRQDQIVTIFYQNDPVGLFAADQMNLQYSATREQSYLRPYPIPFLQRLIAEGNSNVIALSYFIIAKSWRNTRSKHLIDLFAGLAAKCFLRSSANGIICMTRESRVVNEPLMRCGYEVCAHLSSHGRKASILTVNRNSLKTCNIPGINETVNHLWHNRLDFYSPVTEIDEVRNYTTSSSLVV